MESDAGTGRQQMKPKVYIETTIVSYLCTPEELMGEPSNVEGPDS